MRRVQAFVSPIRPGDVERFIELLPDWEELSRGLDAVVLAPGSHYSYGYHRSGVVPPPAR